MSYLVDTSVITRLAHPAVRSRLRDLDGAGLARTPMTDLEVGFSARNAAEWDELLRALDAFTMIEMSQHHFERARQVQRMLADRGLRGRKVPDLLIAAAAESTARTVLHFDRDYDHIASATAQAVEWIIEPGSID